MTTGRRTPLHYGDGEDKTTSLSAPGISIAFSQDSALSPCICSLLSPRTVLLSTAGSIHKSTPPHLSTPGTTPILDCICNRSPLTSIPIPAVRKRTERAGRNHRAVAPTSSTPRAWAPAAPGTSATSAIRYTTSTPIRLRALTVRSMSHPVRGPWLRRAQLAQLRSASCVASVFAQSAGARQTALCCVRGVACRGFCAHGIARQGALWSASVV